MNLAVIPARGGSKRIPRKNIRTFRGLPMVAWSIAAAWASGLFDHVIVSTDDPEIARVAREHGAQVPFTRPVELSDDHTGTMPVTAHAVRWALDQGWPLQAVCCIYATAPMLTGGDLERGLRLLDDTGKSFAFAATDYAAPVFRAFHRSEDGGVAMLFPEHHATRSQDLPRVLHDAGQFYWGRPKAWLEAETLFGSDSAPLEIPRSRVQDIDTPEDWLRAEALCRVLDEPGA